MIFVITAIIIMLSILSLIRFG